MVMLVTLQQASDHLRRDSSDDDVDLELKIHAASHAVINYLKDGADFIDSSGDVETDSNGNIVGVPKVVQLAVLYLVGIFYTDRDGENPDLWQLGYLPYPVQCLLYPLRDPAMG